MNTNRNIFNLERVGDGLVLAHHCRVADSMGARMLGLMFRNSMHPEEALWLEPCNSVHTFFMRFPIDVIFLDREKVVKKIVPNLSPWRLSSIVLSSRSVLEMSSGSAARLGLRAGDRLCLKRAAS